MVFEACSGGSGHVDTLVRTRSWSRLLWLIRERPVTVAVVDSAFLGGRIPADELLTDLRRRFPSLGIVFVARDDVDPHTLLRIGRAEISDLAFSRLDDVEEGVVRGLRRSRLTGARGRVLQAVGNRLPALGRRAVGRALDGALEGWKADDLAGSFHWTRAHLSVHLRSLGLPSAGHLLIWSRLLHAGHWLPDPGRTGESVGRQLEYANGSTFRRALRRCVGATPSEIRAAGGLEVVLARFLDECRLGGSVERGLSVA